MGARKSGLLAAALFLGAMTPALAQPFTLNEALAVTYETNPLIGRDRASLEALDQGVAQANAGWRPSVNVTGSYGVQHSLVDGFASPFNSHPISGQVEVSEPIFRGGRTVAEVGQAIAQVRAGRAQLLVTEQNTLLSAATAYMDVVRDTQTIGYNRDNVSSLEKVASAVHAQLAAGEVTKTDSLEAEARLARARSDEAQAEAQLSASRAAFESLIGRPAETLEASPALPHIPLSKENALDTALRQNPNLLLAKANTKAADYAVDDAAGALLPQLSVTGQYQYLKDASGTNIFATKNPQWVGNVLGQVTVPIYQGGGDEATVRRAKDQRNATEISIAVTERGVRQDLDTAWQQLLSAQRSVVANDAQIAADQGAVSGVKQEQQAGERSVIDVLNAQEELFAAQVAAAEAHHDNVVAAFRVMEATGQLTAQALKLNVHYYDPHLHYEENADAWFGFDD